MDDDGKKFDVQRYVPGTELTVLRMNEAVDAVNAINAGVGLPEQNDAADWPMDFPAQYLKARLVLTTARALSGLALIDGSQPQTGDYILVATGGVPGTDGLYQASAGPWFQLARLNYNQAGIAPVYPHGKTICIWEGTVGPFLWRTKVDTFGATF